MASQHQIQKFYELTTLEQRGNEVLRPPGLCSDMLNVDFLDDDAGTNRLGSKVRGGNEGNNGGFGAFTYTKINDDGSVTVEKLICGSKLFRVLEGSLNITYSGSGTSVSATNLVDPDTGTWVFTLYVDGIEEYSLDLGVGYDEASPVTVNTLKAGIDALTDFAATVTGTNTVPAAFLKVLESEPFESNALAVEFLYNEQVNQPTGATDPFAGSYTNRNAADFENISSEEIGNCRYFANGYDAVKKYDGNDCYNSGLPKASCSVAINATGSVVAGTYKHFITHIQHDAAGNRVEGPRSEIQSTTLSATDSFDVTVDNLLAASGYNTDCAIVAGGQNSVNIITVDDGSGGNHTMKVGQTAYFYDTSVSDFTEREITAVTATTITIAGAAVNVADNSVISNNLRIGIYRTLIGGSIGRLVREIPNNSFTATQVFNDNALDTALGASYLDPEGIAKEHAPPPMLKYLTVFGNLLIGILGNDVYFSHVDQEGIHPEYFPTLHKFPARSNSNSPLTGAGSSGAYLFVFKDDRYARVTGDLINGQFSVDWESERIGCVAHSGIGKIDQTLFVPGKRTIYASNNGSPLVDVGKSIYRYFLQAGVPAAYRLNFRRAVAIDDDVRQKYILFVPAETTTSGDVHANINSVLLVWDDYRQGWLVWQGWNAAGGMMKVDDDLYFVERRYSTFGSQMSYLVHKRLNTGTAYDYADHVSAISWRYRAGWDAYGQPRVLKHFQKLAGYANNATYSADYVLHVDVEYNFQPGVVSSEFDLPFGGGGGSGFGDGAFGDFPFGDPASDQILDRTLTANSATSMRPTFRHETIYKRVIFTGWEVELSAPYKISMRTTEKIAA